MVSFIGERINKKLIRNFVSGYFINVYFDGGNFDQLYKFIIKDSCWANRRDFDLFKYNKKIKEALVLKK